MGRLYLSLQSDSGSLSLMRSLQNILASLLSLN